MEEQASRLKLGSTPDSYNMVLSCRLPSYGPDSLAIRPFGEKNFEEEHHVDVRLGHSCEVDLGKEKADPNFQDNGGEFRRWCP